MLLGKNSQLLAGTQFDALRREQFRTGKRNEVRVLALELCADRLVLFPQDAAGGVDEASAGLHQPRRGTEDVALLRRQLGDRARAVPPFQGRISSKRAEAAARRIDEHAIEFSREPSCARLVLTQDEGVNVGDSGACGARRSPG